MYEIRLPRTGWWAQIDHADSLAALEALAPTVPGLGERLRLLTTGALTGDEREITTLLAHVVRQQRLDDGSQPLGISYPSKTLMGRCWAYWDRRMDDGLPPGVNDLQQLTSGNVGPDPDFTFVADHYGLPILRS